MITDIILKIPIGVIITDTTAFPAFRNEMAAVPQVTALAGTRSHIGYGYRNIVTEAEGKKNETNFLEVGRDYIKTMNLKLAEGREFDPQMEGDYTSSILITQNLAANYGWKDKEALGKKIFIDSSYYSVVGILKDFKLDQLFDPIEPVAMKLGKENRYQFLVMQAKIQDIELVYTKARDAWKKIFPMKPFNGFYQNEITKEAYQTDQQYCKDLFLVRHHFYSSYCNRVVCIGFTYCNEKNERDSCEKSSGCQSETYPGAGQSWLFLGLRDRRCSRMLWWLCTDKTLARYDIWSECRNRFIYIDKFSISIICYSGHYIWN
jgi:hypothetical protein